MEEESGIKLLLTPEVRLRLGSYLEDLVDGAKDIEVGCCAHIALVGREAEHCDCKPLLILGLL